MNFPTEQAVVLGRLPCSTETGQLMFLANSPTETAPMQTKILINLALMLAGCFVVNLGGGNQPRQGAGAPVRGGDCVDWRGHDV